ncbi:MAG: hypothetical protein CMB99_11605 [Flavobacteriaceae bacterium]|nr:hypothetical protein [Flavobacteriaceae bacterium]|tara:strand:- start:240680 stop:240910 length:231 start_codon:yes stop_codon:yes gene_type:complete
MIYDIVGYIALIINLYSMYTKGEFKLRMFSLIANSIYIIYGALIGALPIVIGCSIAVFLHAKRMRNLKLESNANHQ